GPARVRDTDRRRNYRPARGQAPGARVGHRADDAALIGGAAGRQAASAPRAADRRSRSAAAGLTKNSCSGRPLESGDPYTFALAIDCGVWVPALAGVRPGRRRYLMHAAPIPRLSLRRIDNDARTRDAV